MLIMIFINNKCCTSDYAIGFLHEESPDKIYSNLVEEYNKRH